MAIFRILHISDIHIGMTNISQSDIAYKVSADIFNNCLNPLKCIVVTGDIYEGTLDYDEQLLNKAVSFFELLLSEINENQKENPLNKNDILFVPGNHDIIRTDDKNLKWKKYRDFIEAFYKNWPDIYNKESFSLIRRYDEYKIAFIGFNSCRIEKKAIFDKDFINSIDRNTNTDKLASVGINKEVLLRTLQDESVNEYADYGEIALQDITAVGREIKKLDGYNIIAFFHHHFYLFPEIAQKIGDSGLIRNHATITQYLKQMNVKTILHGHKHYDLERPFITEDYYKTTDSIIDVFAGGSVGTIRKDQHTFSIIDIYPQNEDVKLTQRKFVYKEQALEVISKQIPPKNITTKVLKLLELLKVLDPDTSRKYTTAVEQIFKIYSSCNQIISWLNEAITGFTDVFQLIEKDYRNILFMLYAVQLRTLSYMTRNNGDKEYYQSSINILKEFYADCIATPEFDLSLDEYHSLFSIRRLHDVAKKCDQYINRAKNITSQQNLAFTMVAVFFTDLYLVLTQYSDEFYNDTIKYKVNIKLEENKFHQNVPAPRIVIYSDVDRRSAYIQMLCNEATAHKMAVLFVKEFDLLINKFEDYFKIIGLKLYYLLPKIDKDNLKDTLDNYNFEAYIPTLLPLLTGDNIYPSKVVFARELIQNSIDAIAVRRAKIREDFDETINIDLGIDDSNRRYFSNTDCGTGMDRYKIARYFTSIGRSFYSGDEYSDLEISYKPISNFGIGFLSSFMVCKEIDVKTKYYLPDSEGLSLHIPNYDGCFFIDRDDTLQIGTVIKLYLNQDEISNEDIIKYLKTVMLDIRFDIKIKSNNKTIEIAKRYIRRRGLRELQYFVPLTADGEIIDLSFSDTLNDDVINNFDYGVLIKYGHQTKSIEAILNAGILVQNATLDSFFDFEKDNRSPFRAIREKPRYDRKSSIIVNFPANWIQLDVSRENCTGYSEYAQEINDNDNIGIRISNVLYKQILSSLNYYNLEESVDISLSSMQNIINIAMCFSGRRNNDIYPKLKSISYKMFIRLFDNRMELEIRNHSYVKGNSVLETNTHYTNSFLAFCQKHRIHNRYLEDTQINFFNEKEIAYKSDDEVFITRHYKYDYHEIYRIFDRISDINDITPEMISKLLYGNKGTPKEKIDENELFKILILALADFIAENLVIQRAKNNDRIKKIESVGIYSILQTYLLHKFTIRQFAEGKAVEVINYSDLLEFIEGRFTVKHEKQFKQI